MPLFKGSRPVVHRAVDDEYNPKHPPRLTCRIRGWDINNLPLQTRALITLAHFGMQRKKTEKHYGALFTCLTTHAVHIEIAHSLDTDSYNMYLMTMRRMMARRGQPAHIWSDNGTNFVGTEKELREAMKCLVREQVGNQLSVDGVLWHFNPPSSPDFGGVWERLVQSTKRVAVAGKRKQCVNDETLLTFMAKVDSLLNGRPLTHVTSDYRDEEALTRNHFLLGRANPNCPSDVVNDKDLCSPR